MKPYQYPSLLRAVAIASLVLAVSLTAPEAKAQDQQDVTLESGTVLPVKLTAPLSSKTAEHGDTFTTTVVNDEGAGYKLPNGTRVDGVVNAVRPQRGNDPGVLDLSFRRIRLPDGRSYPITGSLIGLDNKSVKHTEDGRLIATPSHQNNRLTYVGYGAGAGLIAGILTKHTLEDTLIGGGLGYLFGSLSKSHADARDVNLKAGSEFGVRLDRQVALGGFDEQGSASRYHRTMEGRRARGDNSSDMSRDNSSDLSSPDASDTGGIGVMVGGKNISFNSNAQPVMSRGTVLVPLRPVLDQAGVPYRYDATHRVIRTNGPNGPARISLGSPIAVVSGGRRIRLEAPAQRLNGTIYVPMRFLGLATGGDVNYDSGSQTVELDAP